MRRPTFTEVIAPLLVVLFVLDMSGRRIRVATIGEELEPLLKRNVARAEMMGRFMREYRSCFGRDGGRTIISLEDGRFICLGGR